MLNSPLTNSVLNELSLVDTVLYSDSDIIKSQTGKESERKTLEAKATEVNYLRTDIIRALSDYYTQNSDWNSAALLYKSRGDYEQSFAYYLQDSNFDGAKEMVDAIAKNGDNALSSLLRIHMMQIVNGKSVDSLSSDDSTTISKIAFGDPTGCINESNVWRYKL